MEIGQVLRITVALLMLVSAPAMAQPAPGDIALTPVVTTLSGPVGVMNAGDRSNRLFVIQQGGAVRIVRDSSLVPTPYFTLSNGATQCRETSGGPLANTGFTLGSEQGLLGLAFHPQFESNGHLFVSYSGANGDTIVARLTAASPAADVLTAADLQTCLIVLRVDQDFANHNGGNVVFGPGGLLYFGLGDGGSGNDPCDRGQTLNPANLVNTSSSCPSDTSFTDPDGNGTPDRPAITRALLGKMLRIDVNGTTPAGANGLCGARLDGAANYAIPADNPFAGADAQSGCDEVWAYGFRNPWRWSFDRFTNDFIIGDVGQDQWEEVNFFSAASGGGSGANADWRICEARHLRNSCMNLCPAQDTAEVIIAYNNTGGCTPSTPVTGSSVTGGYRYRGPDPLLQGVYFYGDAGRTSLYFSTQSGGNWSQPDASTTVPNAAAGVVVAFGEDEAGALYMIGGNTLTRIGAAANPDVIFANSFE